MKNIFEQKLDTYLVRYPKYKTCVKCGETKLHATCFREIITAAEAERRGYRNHHIRPMKDSSDLCNECNPNVITPAKLKKLTPSEVQQALLDNRISKVEYAAEMKARQNALLRPSKRRLAAQKQWQNVHAQRWAWLRQQLRKDHTLALVALQRHEAGIGVLNREWLRLYTHIKDAVSVVVTRVTDLKRGGFSSTEGVPPFSAIVGAQRSERLKDYWEQAVMSDDGVTRKGKPRKVPFLISQLNRMALDGAPPLVGDNFGRPRNAD